MSGFIKSKSEQFLQKRGAISQVNSGIVAPNISKTSTHMSGGVPQVSALMARSVSEFRRDSLTEEVKQGLYRDGSGPSINEDGITSNSIVSSSIGIVKHAQVVSGGGGGNYRGGNGDVVKQTPEVYSPLWLNSNLNLPRDRPTINAWCRSFYALNPFVHNAINLHSTYPISKLNIKCPNKEIEKFFNDMIEEIDLMNICVQIAQEFWLLGESFVYAELDESQGKWSRLLIQNPDFMLVKRTVVANEPIIMLRPDENLKKIIFSNKPSDIEQKKQLNQHIIDSVKHGENIPLDNFHVSHLARRISPYEIRGTGLPVCIFRQLMLFDKLRESKYAQADNMINPLTLIKIGSADFKPTFADLEAWKNVFECYDEETEVLTDNGFKKFNEVMDYNDSDETIINCKPKEGIKIACFNPDNETLEYYQPDRATLYNYDGDMYHYKNDKIDVKVTPNHDMWVSRKEYQYNGHRSLRESVWGDWHKVKAQDLSLNDYSRFKNDITWEGSEDIKSINVIGHDVPIELYLEYLGYVISEGCIFTDGLQYMVGIYQTTTKHYDKMRACSEAFGDIIRLKCNHGINKRSEKLDLNQKDVWSSRFYNQKLFEHFKNECGDSEGNVKSSNKRIPRWVLDLSPRLLTTLFNALIDGDGSVYDNSKQQSKRFAYYTTSKQLADDVYELIYKCGYVPTSFVRNNDKYIDGRRLPLYTILWSTTNNGKCPLVYKTSRNSQTKEKHNLLTIEKYNGKVWCFTVPTGLFITRRGGKIGIHGNSAQYDKDFKIFTHEGVAVERVGYGSGIFDISGDITQIIKEIYVGLQVPPVLMDGGADTTYANGGVALDVLRQRYMQFRNMMGMWLKRKIFAPISKIQGFYDYSNGEKQLIVPDIDWNHMSLFDAGDYINNLVTLTQGEGPQKRASLHSLYKSMGLEYIDEIRKMRMEAIQDAINAKEKLALASMSLNELRTLDEDDEIPEPETQPGQGAPGEAPLPGEAPPGGMPGLDMGGMGGLPPPPTGMGGEGGGEGGAPPPPPPPGP